MSCYSKGIEMFDQRNRYGWVLTTEKCCLCMIKVDVFAAKIEKTMILLRSNLYAFIPEQMKT